MDTPPHVYGYQENYRKPEQIYFWITDKLLRSEARNHGLDRVKS